VYPSVGGADHYAVAAERSANKQVI